jgi:chromosome segregation ATPase
VSWALGIAAGLAKVDVPWKWIGIALAALAIALTVGAGYLHIENLKSDLVTKAEQLSEEKQARQLAEATTNALKAEHDVQIARISDLEHQRYDIAVEVTSLRSELAHLDLEQDLESDDEQKSDAAIERLNAAHARLDELLRSASGAKAVVRPGKDRGTKAGAAGPGGYFDRALQALR